MPVNKYDPIESYLKENKPIPYDAPADELQAILNQINQIDSPNPRSFNYFKNIFKVIVPVLSSVIFVFWTYFFFTNPSSQSVNQYLTQIFNSEQANDIDEDEEIYETWESLASYLE